MKLCSRYTNASSRFIYSLYTKYFIFAAKTLFKDWLFFGKPQITLPIFKPVLQKVFLFSLFYYLFSAKSTGQFITMTTLVPQEK